MMKYREPAVPKTINLEALHCHILWITVPRSSGLDQFSRVTKDVPHTTKTSFGLDLILMDLVHLVDVVDGGEDMRTLQYLSWTSEIGRMEALHPSRGPCPASYFCHPTRFIP